MAIDKRFQNIFVELFMVDIQVEIAEWSCSVFVCSDSKSKFHVALLIV